MPSAYMVLPILFFAGHFRLTLVPVHTPSLGHRTYAIIRLLISYQYFAGIHYTDSKHRLLDFNLGNMESCLETYMYTYHLQEIPKAMY